jgi:hypothetical protein
VETVNRHQLFGETSCPIINLTPWRCKQQILPKIFDNYVQNYTASEGCYFEQTGGCFTKYSPPTNVISVQSYFPFATSIWQLLVTWYARATSTLFHCSCSKSELHVNFVYRNASIWLCYMFYTQLLLQPQHPTHREQALSPSIVTMVSVDDRSLRRSSSI